MAYIFEHTRFGFCWWDLLMIILLIVLIIVFIVQMHKLNKRKKKLEDKVADIYSEQVEIK